MQSCTCGGTSIIKNMFTHIFRGEDIREAGRGENEKASFRIRYILTSLCLLEIRGSHSGY
jgi:hypothetical protein